MLKELDIDVEKLHWKDIKKVLKDDLRYLNVENSRQRKLWFKEYIKVINILNLNKIGIKIK